MGIDAALPIAKIIAATSKEVEIQAWDESGLYSIQASIAGGKVAPANVTHDLLPTGLRMLSARAPDMIPWAWGMNGALSVLGATLAIFVAMNWGFRITLISASVTYLLGLLAFLAATQHQHAQ